MSVPSIKRQYMTLCCAIFSFFIPSLLCINYVMNRFYVDGTTDGGEIIDSGWYIYMSSSAVTWPLPNPSVIGGTFFSVHMSFIFYVFSALFHLLHAIGVSISAPFFFAITQGIGVGILSLASFGLMLATQNSRTMGNIFLCMLFAFFVSVNGISLQAILHPHFEMLIPALLIAFFALWTNGYKKLAYVPLLLNLLVKEDVGLHQFGAFFILAFFCRYCSQDNVFKEHARAFFKLAMICGIYSVIVIAAQKIFFHPNIMTQVYLGNPIYQHINFEFLKNRWDFNLIHRTYIYVPLLLCALLALWRKEKMLLLGVITVLPWTIFSFLAPGPLSGAPSAGSLNYYYGFPIILAYLWPAICYGLYKNFNLLKRSYLSYWMESSGIVIMSTLLFCLFSGMPPDVPYNGYHYPVHSFGWKWTGVFNNNQTTLDKILLAKDEQVLVDHATATLEFDKVTNNNLYPDDLKFTDSQLENIRLFIFQTNTEREKQINRLIEKLKFSEPKPLAGTNYMISTRHTSTPK